MRHSNERLPWRAVQSHEGFNHLTITSSKNPARRITDSPLSSHSFENPQSDQEFQKYDDDFKKIALQWEIPAVESIEKEIDPSTDEGVKDLRDYVATKRFEIDGWRNSEYFLQSSETIQAFYQSLGLKISDLSDLLRHQDESLFSFNEAFSQGDNIGAEKVELEISQRAERIIDTYNAVEEKLEELDIAVNQEEETSQDTDKKTGWWDKDFQVAQGQEIRNIDGTLNQRWGENSDDIGFKPEPIAAGKEEGRTGWWKDEYREDLGFGPSVPEGPLTQRGDVSVPGDPNSLKTDRFISRPVSGGRTGQVEWSLRDSESFSPDKQVGLFPTEEFGTLREQVLDIHEVINTEIFPNLNEDALSESDKKEFHYLMRNLEALESVVERADSEIESLGGVNPNTINYFHTYYKDVASAVELFSNLKLNNDRIFNVDKEAELPGGEENPKEETVSAPVNPAYEQVRQEWMGAKAEHEIKRQEYLTAVDDFYKNWSEEISNKSFFGKIGSSIKAKFGFKPDLPEEVLALREASFAATESYGQKAREMTEKRELAGKKSRGEISEAMLERYNRRFGHEAVFNTFKAQVESQAAAAESLGFKPGKISSYLIENKNVIKLTGAFALGAATGGLAGVVAGGAWWARSTAGGAAAAGVAGLANKKWTEDINRWSEEQQEAQVRSLAEKINDKSLTKEEISEQYGKLEAILAQVDEKNRTKMLKVIAAAGLTGALVGGAAGAIGEEVFGIGAEIEAVNGDVPSTDGPAGVDARVTGASVDASPDITTQPAGAGEQAATANAEVPEYVAQKGDNFWDIMEGQTDAGKPAYLDHVDASHKQEIIDLVRDRIEDDPAMLKELGFGENADQLQIGAEVDTERLNELAEEIAKEKGWHIEAAPDAADVPPAPETPPAGADQTKVLDAKGAPEAAVVTNVSPDKINDFARGYPKGLYPTGFQNFNHDFQTLWVDRVQGPPPALGGFLDMFFNKAPLSDSAYNEFDSYTIGDFKKLATIDESVLASTLTAKNIDMADYFAWKDEIARWEKEGLVIDPKDRFSDVAEAAFINSLEKTKAV